MLLRRFYYQFKPLVPYQLRYALRRRLAQRHLRRSSSVWSIDERAGNPPPGWPGWPDGKDFSFVLTHDVEGVDGLSKCQRLAELEGELGFRSSFNFIPEGDYSTSPELRDYLVRSGFEVGVHDLNHDGHLYRSRNSFRKKAARINNYLKEWNAVGFRSGFMHHNYEWLQDLNVLYDASSFDTDPFEPQPDGVQTIFPFWMKGSGNRGYVELPYTLAQDSTLFLILRQKSDAIWRRKLDWIVERRGMALVNVHPDYIAFDGEPFSGRTFSVQQYREFLLYVKERYAGRYWHCLPKDMAAFARRVPVSQRPARARRVCMISASVYERDNRVIRYAQTLVDRGDSVDAIALAHSKDSPKREDVGGINVRRIGFKTSRGGKLSQLFAALSFLVRSSVLLTGQHFRRRYDLVHVHNMPDFLVFAAWLPRLTGAAVLLDIHDILPEFYATRFAVRSNALLTRSLRLVEKLCAGFSNHVIISNHVWRDTFVSRSASPSKCSVFVNSVDSRLFRPVVRTRASAPWVIIYPGSFNRHQGLDVAIRAMPLVKQKVPAAELHLYGIGPAMQSLTALAKELNLNGSVRFFDPVPLTRMPEILANADVGIVPKRASDFFGNQAFSTKIMEFMSQGLPVVVSRTLIDSYYYDDQVVRFFESENVEELAKALIELAHDGSLRNKYAQNGREFVARNSWDTKRQEYLDLVDSIVS